MNAHGARSGGRARLSVGAVYRDAVLTYRARAGRVVGTATIILVPITAVQVVLADFGHHSEPAALWAKILYVLAVLAVAGAGVFAATFYAGAVDRTVGAVRGQIPERDLAQIFRELPYWRLIRASLLYAALVVVGTLALVIPGLVATTLFSIIGPVMLVEDRAVLDTFRRSYHLARPNFWRVALTTLVPLSVETFISDLLLTSSSHPSLVIELLVECAFAALVSSFVGLLETQTAYQLIELDRERPPPSPG